MMKKDRDLKLQNYNMSPNRYRELKFFCKQYREKQLQLRSITELSLPGFDGARGGNKISDRTGDTALRRIQLEKELEIIEQSAMEAGDELYPYILSNVVGGVRYEHLEVPMSRASFFRRRKRFFEILSGRK